MICGDFFVAKTKTITNYRGFRPHLRVSGHRPISSISISCALLVIPVCLVQRWFPLSPPTLKAEDPLLDSEGWSSAGGGPTMQRGGNAGQRATCTEQRRAVDFAHYNPVIQVCSEFVSLLL